MYLRARDVAFKESGGFNPLAIKAWWESRAPTACNTCWIRTSSRPSGRTQDERTGEYVGEVYREPRASTAADRTGLKSAQTALELLRCDLGSAERPA